MDITINVASYLTRPQIDVTIAIALTYTLRAAWAPSLGEGARAALDEVERSGAALETAWKAQQAQVSTDNRPVFRSVANAWSATVARVQSYTLLPAERHHHHGAAVRILALLADDGKSFLQSPYPSIWITMKTRLDLVREEGLDDELVAIAGKEFVDEVQHCHGAFGRALGITEAPSLDVSVSLLDLLREHGQAVTDYALQVLATVKRGDADTVQRALLALKPIDDAREAAASRRNVDAQAPAQPVAQPVVTPQPVASPAAPAAKPVAAPAVPQRVSVPPTN